MSSTQSGSKSGMEPRLPDLETETQEDALSAALLDPFIPFAPPDEAFPDDAPLGIPTLDPLTEPQWSFARLIISASTVKFITDTAAQVFSPYLPIIAAGLGTNLIVAGRLAGIVNLMGLTAPLFGALADRSGYRNTLRLVLLLSSVGLALVTVSPGVGIATVGFIIFGLGRGGFLPVLQSYLSARLPYEQRARGLGILEYSWALAGIIGLSLVGVLIAYTNWRVPLALLAALLFAASFFVRGFPPSHHAEKVEHAPHRADAPAQPWAARVRSWFDFGPTARSTWACMATGAFIFFGASQIFITYGAWLTDVWGMQARDIGVAVLVLGLFDLAASVGVSVFTDRFGKWRSVHLGAVVAVIGYLLMTRVATTPALAVLAIAIPRIGFEFAIVAYFSLLSEQAPAYRSRVMSMGAAVSLSLATFAGFIAPPIYTTWGMGGVGISSALITSIAIVLLLTLVRERGGVTD